MSDIALKVENLTKEYRLGTIGHGTLREDLQSFFARVRGKEDPNSLVTAKHSIESDEKHFLALDNLNFEIKKGDRVGIIGKNGAGKSTLLKVLSRITAPTKGNVYINGRIGSLLEVGTGFHPELSGRENIYLSGSIMGMKKIEIDKKLDEIIDFSGVEKFIDTPVKRYSSGMFVRLGFAVAAHLEPDILIVDEVLAVGDAEFQKKAIGKMEDVSKNDGRTVLFVSHNMSSIQKLCNVAFLLEKGKNSETGNVNDVIGDYLSDKSITYLPDKKNKIVAFYLEEIYIMSKGKLSSNNFFSCDDDLDFFMVLNVNSLSLGCQGYFAIKNISDDIVVEADSNDAKLNSLNELKIGRNDIRIRIPKRLLSPGNYIIYLNFTDSERKTVFSPGNVLSFNLSDKKTIRGNKRRGFTSTILKWEIL